MVADFAKLGQVNVLASELGWAWPQAMYSIFQPRGINLLVARSPAEFVNVIEHKRIHTIIVDSDSPEGGLVTVRIVRADYPTMPCILLASRSGPAVLDEALRMGVFSVMDKPVDLELLRQQLNRLFLKMYNSDVFM